MCIVLTEQAVKGASPQKLDGAPEVLSTTFVSLTGVLFLYSVH